MSHTTSYPTPKREKNPQNRSRNFHKEAKKIHVIQHDIQLFIRPALAAHPRGERVSYLFLIVYERYSTVFAASCSPRTFKRNMFFQVLFGEPLLTAGVWTRNNFERAARLVFLQINEQH